MVKFIAIICLLFSGMAQAINPVPGGTPDVSDSHLFPWFEKRVQIDDHPLGNHPQLRIGLAFVAGLATIAALGEPGIDDKTKHVIAGFGISFGYGVAFNVGDGWILGVGIGALKEGHDAYCKCGDPDVTDFAATALGASAAYGLLDVIGQLRK